MQKPEACNFIEKEPLAAAFPNASPNDEFSLLLLEYKPFSISATYTNA